MKGHEIIYRWLKTDRVLRDFAITPQDGILTNAEIVLMGSLTDQNHSEAADLVNELHEGGLVSLQRFEAVVAQRHAHVLLAFDESDGHKIVGTGTLFVLEQMTGHKAAIEDVVVKESCRGYGIGEGIVRKLIERARLLNAASVSLTSKPARKAANALYVKLGFERRETNVYRLRFPSGRAS